jgi:hypothetical protein
MTTAASRYADMHCECCNLLEQITEDLGDLDAPRERTTYGHVGDLSLVRDKLQAVADVLNAIREPRQ